MNDGFTLAFIQDKQQRTYAATGLDLVLYGNDQTWPKLVQTIKNLTVEDAFNPLLPELYRVIYNEKDRLPELAAITDADIMAAKQLGNKIVPCTQIV